MLQSPLTQSNEPISPLQIVAHFIQGRRRWRHARADPSALARALLPGNVAAAYMKGETPVDMTDTAERGIEIATLPRCVVEDHKNHEMWVAASWASVFGALISSMQRRTRFLSLLGVLLFEYTMLQRPRAFGAIWAAGGVGAGGRQREILAIGAGAEAE